MKQLFILLLVPLLVIHTGTAQNVGGIAPDFSLQTLSDQNYTLSASRGDVILVFLVGYNCPLCIASAPTVKSEILDVFISNPKFQSVIIDTWDGSASAFQNFKNTTNLQGVYLQKGSKVATSWASTYDRLVVIDSEGKMVFKGNSAASSTTGGAKQAIETALSQLTTSLEISEKSENLHVAAVYPNPFSTEATATIYLPLAAKVSVVITDIAGKEMGKPVNHFFPPGESSFKLIRDNLKQGIYFLRLDAGQQSVTQKIMVK